MATTPAPNPLLQLTPSQVNWAQTAQWKTILQQALADARFASPAFAAEDMDTVTQTVTVQIALQERVRTSGGPQWMDVPPIILVPVVLPRAGGWALTMPVKKGDEGLLVFCDACMDLWWANGQTNSPPPTYPTGAASSGSQRQNEIRRHHVHDCGFQPGMVSQPNVLSNYSSISMQLRSYDGSTLIDLSSNGVAAVSSTAVSLSAPAVHAANGGTPQALINDTFYQWWTTEIFPFLQSKGYAGPGIPAGSETTVLKGQ